VADSIVCGYFSYNRRKLDELPFQVFQLSGSIKKEFLYNHSWLYVKLCGSDVYHVSSNYNFVVKCYIYLNSVYLDLINKMLQ